MAKHLWDFKVHDERFYGRLLKNTSLFAGESYIVKDGGIVSAWMNYFLE